MSLNSKVYSLNYHQCRQRTCTCNRHCCLSHIVAWCARRVRWCCSSPVFSVYAITRLITSVIKCSKNCGAQPEEQSFSVFVITIWHSAHGWQWLIMSRFTCLRVCRTGTVCSRAVFVSLYVLILFVHSRVPLAKDNVRPCSRCSCRRTGWSRYDAATLDLIASCWKYTANSPSDDWTSPVIFGVEFQFQ